MSVTPAYNKLNMFSKEVYQQRRQRICELLPDSFLLFVGNAEEPFNYAGNTYSFRQDSTFLYLFGIDSPNYAATIDTATGNVTIYADDVTLDDTIWTGELPSVAVVASLVGVATTKPSSALAEDVKCVMKYRRVHYVPASRASSVQKIASILGLQTAAVNEYVSEPLIKSLVSMRSVKEQCEIEELENYMRVGYDMHVSAMKMAREGNSEQVIRSVIDYMSLRNGGHVSFPTICTVHGEILHNSPTTQVLKNGDLLLVDAGSESPLHYATDNTRTTPVGGHFSQQQREIYNIVLNANNAVAAAVRPGVFYRDMHLLAMRTIVDGLSQLGIMKGNIDDAVANGAYALFCPHGVGHMLGLDVHDMEGYGENYVGYDEEVQRSTQFGFSALRMARRLQAGFIVTDEPGIYFIPALIDKWQAEGICKDFINYEKLHTYRNFGGIRLEDDLLITPNGGRVLGQRIPINPNEVESIVCNANK